MRDGTAEHLEKLAPPAIPENRGWYRLGRHAYAEIQAFDGSIKVLDLKVLPEEERGKGHGREAVQLLCELADELDVTLRADVAPDGSEVGPAGYGLAIYFKSNSTISDAAAARTSTSSSELIAAASPCSSDSPSTSTEPRATCTQA